MIVLGVILLVTGFIAVVIGAVFAIAGFAGHEIGGRKHVF